MAAQSGSMQAVAAETGLSVSTVSHHLRSLEGQLGVSLIDHSRRPMVLTLTSNVFLNDIDEALRLIRKVEVEATSGNMGEARSLRLACRAVNSPIIPARAMKYWPCCATEN